MDGIRLTSDVYRAIVGHAYMVLPAEAVGLLGGPVQGYATHSISLSNRAGQRAFLADPFDQFKAERHLARLGLQLVAVYHSHPGGGTQLSPLDLVFGRQRTCLQVVIALDRVDLPGEETRAYRVIENMAVEVEMHIVG
jgi:proteasome lid subunit RPN8/RPN11